MIFSAYFKGTHKVYAWSMMIALMASVGLEAWVLTELNTFIGLFWEAIGEYDKATTWEIFFPQSLWYDGSFTWIAITLVANGALLSYFSNKWTFWWRQSIIEEYIPQYLKVNKNVEGAAQRIQEDTYKFAKFVRDLGRGFLKAIFILIGFIPLLFTLSEMHWSTGYFVWIALAISVGGILISLWVGRKLPQLEYNNQRVEATFRKQLVLLEDDREAFTDKTLFETFDEIRKNYFTLFNNYFAFSVWSRVYWQTAIFVPLIFALPQYFAVKFSVGILHQIANAFGKVHESFSYLVDNWTMITELRSVQIRLDEFETVIYPEDNNKK